MAAPSRRRELLGLFLRIALTAGVFALLFSRIDINAVSSSIQRIPMQAVLGAVGALLSVIAAGIVRWRILLRAYGAERLPSWRFLTRWFLVAMFYNLLPGAVGGDVLRGLATRGYFAEGSATRSVGVVFVERVLGLSGLLLLCALATVASASFDPQVLLYTSLGLCAAGGAIVALAIGRRFAGLLPEKLAKIARSLPTIERPGAFALAIVLSVYGHVAISLAGHVVIASLSPDVEVAQSMVIFPLGTLASIFPLTVAGAGARDTALVFLFERIGVARADALATSLFLLVCNMGLSAIGGLFQGRKLFGASEQAAAAADGRRAPASDG